MSFVFVENATIDRKTRKKIRSHVMQGKNAGRTIHRPSRINNHLRPSSEKSEDGVTQMKSENCPKRRRFETMMIEAPQKTVGHMFSGQIFPVSLSWENRNTIHQFITIVTNGTYTNQNDYSNPFAPKHSLWMRFFGWVWDEALFHCTLCMMEASSDFFLERRQPSQSSLNHVSQAIKLANRRLSSEKALSNKTLYVVLALTLYEQLRGDLQKWTIHLRGLYQLIDLRGGLANVLQCDGIVEKTCRLDITHALATGCATHFRLSDIPFITQYASYHNNDYTTKDPHILKSFSHVHPALLNVFIDIMALVDKVNDSRLPGVDSYAFTASLITLNYRLIEISSLQNCIFTNAIDEGLHLGLTSFMLTLTLQFGRRRLPNQDILSGRLKDFFQSKITEIMNENSLLLWLLFISNGLVFNKIDGSWLHPLVATEVERLEIADWKDLHTRLHRYPWVHSVHNDSAQRMLDQVFRAGTKELSCSTVDGTRTFMSDHQDQI